jgi:Tfp pilus assembly protein PilF
MKKAILIIAVLGVSMAGKAQEKYVVSAGVALNGHNLDEAKENIDKAMQGDTKEKPKALFIKGEIYTQMQTADKYKSSNPYREAAQALMKLAEIKADYEKDNTDQMLLFCANYYYNDGVRVYSDKSNDKRYAESADCMRNVIKIHDLNDGKRFEKSPRARLFDTMAANAALIIASGAYLQGNNDEAIPLLTNVIGNPVTQTPSAYEMLITAYDQQKKTAEAYAVIEQGRKAFPKDPSLQRSELNYFIRSGKTDELVKKLEEAAASDPNNPDIQFNLATSYLSMANPKDGKRPANYDELNKKSEAAFQSALKLSPDNVAVNYNFGAFYFNQATEVNIEMNATPDAEHKKYDDLKAKRDMLFNSALPYLEKAYSLALPNEPTLKGEDLNSYRSTISALKTIYAAESKNDKAAEMSKKYDTVKDMKG